MPDQDFAGLLKQAMGLDAASVGPAAIARAVQDRQLACQLRSPQAYWEYLRGSAEELQQLIEAVVVPETWFFRDREAFAALGRMACEDWLPRHAEQTLRLLSLPCSTGEEPYSIVMALLDAGFPAERIRVDAIDISERALEQAQRALYGRNSFRGAELGFRDRHFTDSGSGQQLHDSIRRCVNFQQGNMFAAGFLPGAERYDAVFCRNVLIYFDRPTQDRAIQLLERLLSPSGLLFVAPSETGLLFSHGFISAKVPLAFAFRKPSAGPARPTASVAPPLPARAGGGAAARGLKLPGDRQRPPAVAAAATTGAGAETPARTPAPGLEEALRLADQGLLVDAAQACEAYLRRQGPSPQAYYLLGLVRDSAGSVAEAAHYYRKALYLDPRHQDALLHFALLQEKQGNSADASLLHSRRLRLQQTGQQ
ncbi:MAG: CheR family methyltransferase [Stagnimonas sp.]|nr:CheR family methyltransferase [Stagnimonas sp.]